MKLVQLGAVGRAAHRPTPLRTSGSHIRSTIARSQCLADLIGSQSGLGTRCRGQSSPNGEFSPYAAVSTTRPVICPACSRFSTASAFRNGWFSTGMPGMSPRLAMSISARNSFTLPT